MSGTRTVTIQRRWPDGYFLPLVGVRMPALVEDGHVLTGILEAVDEDAEQVRLTFAGLKPEE